MGFIQILAANSRSFRIERGLSQDKLAEIVDLHRPYFNGTERGMRNVSLRNIEKISGAHDVKVSYSLVEVDSNDFLTKQ